MSATNRDGATQHDLQSSARLDKENEGPMQSSDITLRSESSSSIGEDPEKDAGGTRNTDLDMLERSMSTPHSRKGHEEKAPEKDPNLVEWDGPDDPENPQNMPKWRKWVLTMTLSSLTMWITFASSVFSTATLVTAKEYNVSTEVMTLATSLVVFGFAVGPLMWSPLSELYGRRIPLFSGYAIFAIFQIPVAVAQNVETIMLCRFLMGVFGCSPLAVVGGAMADFWDPVDRAVAIACFSAATFVGPVIGKSSFCLPVVFALRCGSKADRSH